MNKDILMRTGIFYVSEETMTKDPELFLRMMSKFIILKAEFLYHSRSFKYCAHSELFEFVPNDQELPEYDIVVNGDHIEAVKR